MTMVELTKPAPALAKLIRASKRGAVCITRNGKLVAILKRPDPEDREDWLYEHSPDAIKLGRRARAHIRRGQFKTFDEIRKCYPAAKFPK